MILSTFLIMVSGRFLFFIYLVGYLSSYHEIAINALSVYELA